MRPGLAELLGTLDAPRCHSQNCAPRVAFATAAGPTITPIGTSLRISIRASSSIHGSTPSRGTSMLSPTIAGADMTSMPFLADYIWIGGGTLGTILVIVLIVYFIRRA
jgi:uncharacterized membrane protein